MASFKQIKFYLLLLSGLCISVIALYIFFTSEITGTLLHISQNSYAPNLYPHTSNNTNTSNLSVATFKSSAGSYSVNVSIADDDQSREKGLMNVSSLPQNQGMLFIFTDGEQLRNFWMKNTKIPLDMVFLSASKQIVHIEKSTQPCTADPCTIYSSQYPSEYVIEVNGGWTDAHNVQVGDMVSF